MKAYNISIPIGIGGAHGVFRRAYKLENKFDLDEKSGDKLLLTKYNYNEFGKLFSLSDVEIESSKICSIIENETLSDRQKIAEIALIFDRDLFLESNFQDKNSSNKIVIKQLLAIRANNQNKVI